MISELYFRQVTVRSIRVVLGPLYQDAVVYLPADPRLVTMERAILSQRAKALGRVQEVRPDPGSREVPLPLFVPLESQVTGTETVTGGEFLAEEVLLRARQLKATWPCLSHMLEYAVAIPAFPAGRLSRTSPGPP